MGPWKKHIKQYNCCCSHNPGQWYCYCAHHSGEITMVIITLHTLSLQPLKKVKYRVGRKMPTDMWPRSAPCNNFWNPLFTSGITLSAHPQAQEASQNILTVQECVQNIMFPMTIYIISTFTSDGAKVFIGLEIHLNLFNFNSRIVTSCEKS